MFRNAGNNVEGNRRSEIDAKILDLRRPVLCKFSLDPSAVGPSRPPLAPGYRKELIECAHLAECESTSEVHVPIVEGYPHPASQGSERPKFGPAQMRGHSANRGTATDR